MRLDVHDILSMGQVSRMFKSTIEDSPKLQVALWSRPNEHLSQYFGYYTTLFKTYGTGFFISFFL